MPIGSLVPGQPTTVTPDPHPGYYGSFQGPAVDDYIVADHILSVILMVLNIEKRTLGNIGSPAAVMQAIGNAQVADWFFVLNEGLFVYSATTRTDNGPWWYSAPGMSNVGSWVNVYWMSFMGSSSPAKLSDSILPYWQTLQLVNVGSEHEINYSIVSSGWVQVPDTAANPIAYTFTQAQVGQRFELNITPLSINCGSGDTVTVRIHITQNGVSSYYTLPPCSNTFKTELSWPQIVYDSLGTEDIVIALEATNVDTFTSTIKSSNLTCWGSVGIHTWMRFKVMQEF